MFDIFRNAWKITELRKKILYTLMLLFVYRLGSYVPVPGVNVDVISELISGNGLLGMVDLFNGGTLSGFTVFASGITPYITASIVLQLLTVAIPALERLQKQGEEGRKKIAQIVRYVAIIMAMVQSVGIILSMGAPAVNNPSWYTYAIIALIQAAGTAFCMWIGERVTENGIGNGISLLIFINIISKFPGTIVTGIKNALQTPNGFWAIPLVAIGYLAIVVAIVYVDLGVRRIPVQYAKRVVGRRVYGGQSSHIPMKVNNSGVLPIILAMTLIQFPGLILTFFSESAITIWWKINMSSGQPIYGVVTALIIIVMAYFYSTITFNPVEVANNIRQYGGFIPGIRPGRPTASYLMKVSSRITSFSSLFLAVLAVIPMVILAATKSPSPLQATSVLIMVGVALETSKQIESQMLMRHYKGFL